MSFIHESHKQVLTITPILKVLDEIKKTDKNVFLAGPEGSGKSTVLEFINSATSYNLIDGSIKGGEFIMVPDIQIFNFYHTLLLCKKILDYYFQHEQITNYFQKFVDLRNKINFILFKFNSYYIRGETDYSYFSKYDLSHPERLFEILNELLSVFPHTNKNTLIAIDNFDKVGESNVRYQTYMYNAIKDYFRVIITVSDRGVLTNSKRLDSLNQKGQVVKVDYNEDIDTMRQIIAANNGLTLDSDILSSEILQILIEKSNGNIVIMLSAIRSLLKRIHELLPHEYSEYLLHYFEERNDINKMGIVKKERVFYI